MGTAPTRFTILGGGIAGLAVGYFAKKSDIPFTIYEASDRLGGNATTFRHGDFLFDSGAHRLHDRDAEITREIKDLLGDDLVRIDSPSQIFHNGKLIDFPLSPLNLLRNLGFPTVLKAGMEILGSKMSPRRAAANFEEFAVRKYGRDVAERFLLNYSRKLWGLSPNRLSTAIAGQRLKGLDLRTFLVEAFFGHRAKVDHLERSSFYYPKGGIGTIPQSVARFCGMENIHTGTRITRVLHDTRRVTAVEIDGSERIQQKDSVVVSTLPLPLLLHIMEPSPPSELLDLARSLRFRNMILAVYFLDKPSVNSNATTYFPDPGDPFTRGYEPRNRDPGMAPTGRTSFVFEIPCYPRDNTWKADDESLLKQIRSHVLRLGWFREEEIEETLVKRFPFAYPILEVGFEEKVSRLTGCLRGLSNLESTGRNGRFVYSWIHDMMRFGKDLVDDHIIGKLAKPALRSKDDPSSRPLAPHARETRSATSEP